MVIYMNTLYRNNELIISVLSFFIIIAIICGLKIGYIDIPFSFIADILLQNDINNDYLKRIVLEWRLPRLLLAVTSGMGLVLSGIIMQALLKNVFADPYILGVSSGASLGATSAIFLGLGNILGNYFIGVMAFAGALLASFAILLMLKKINCNIDTSKIILIGIAINVLCSSLAGVITFIGKSKEGMEAITFWMMGSLANADIVNVFVSLIIIITGYLFFLTQTRILNLMTLGYEQAVTLGVNLNKYTKLYIFINSIIVGTIVFNAGMIGFIGLLVPHIMRENFGADHKILLPVAVLFGGLYTICIDIVSRTVIYGVEIPIGVVSALLGGPYFIYIMFRKYCRFGGL